MKTGVIDVGGGLRGIYAADVFDYCMDHGIHFDLGIGISAGSANLASFAAGQRGRNYQFYTEYAFRKQYMSVQNFVFKRSFIDMDYVYGTLSRSDGENPLDYHALRDNPMELYVVATDARTGQAKYFEKEDICQDDYSILKASCAIPFVCKPYEVENVPYYDGALGDPVPVEKAFHSKDAYLRFGGVRWNTRKKMFSFFRLSGYMRTGSEHCVVGEHQPDELREWAACNGYCAAGQSCECVQANSFWRFGLFSMLRAVRGGDVDAGAVTRLSRFAYKKSELCKVLDRLQASADCPKGRNRCAGIHTADA